MKLPTFLTRIPRSWIPRATGELFLIILGVLVALAVNNWNMDRQRHRTEVKMLRDMRAALQTDLQALRTAQAAYERRVATMDGLRAALHAGAPYDPKLDAAFGAVYGLQPLTLNRAPYEGLKGAGLDLIDNDALRGEIVHAYENVYRRIETTQEVEAEVTREVLRPYFLKEFRDLKLRESATPLRPGELMSDPYFLNMLEYRASIMKSNSVGLLRTTIPQLEALAKRLDTALGSQAGTAGP